ncbi:MAG: hypothetical protein KBD01_03465 [Acidobacteria bacterium]|nr:hypothetical protein [Acidobacteriota bacterium]
MSRRERGSLIGAALVFVTFATVSTLAVAQVTGWFAPALAIQARAIAESRGLTCTPKVQFALGGAPLRAGLVIARAASGEPIPTSISRLELAVCEVAPAAAGAPRPAAPELDGEVIVRVREKGQLVEVRAIEDGDGELAGLNVFVLDGTDMITARLEGDLESLLEQGLALARRHRAFEHGERLPL